MRTSSSVDSDGWRWRFAAGGGGVLVGLPLVVDGAALGAGDFLGDFADELLERGDGGGVEVGAGDADVGVEVGDGVGEVAFRAARPTRSSR